MTQAESVTLEAQATENLQASLAARNSKNFCEVYSYCRPILEAVSRFWFLGSKMKKIIGDLIAVADAVCPVGLEVPAAPKKAKAKK